MVIDLTEDGDNEFHEEYQNYDSGYLPLNDQISLEKGPIKHDPVTTPNRNDFKKNQENSLDFINADNQMVYKFIDNQDNMSATRNCIKTVHEGDTPLHDSAHQSDTQTTKVIKSSRTITDALMENFRGSSSKSCDPLCQSAETSAHGMELSVKSSITAVTSRRERERTPRKRKQTSRFCDLNVRLYIFISLIFQSNSRLKL